MVSGEFDPFRRDESGGFVETGDNDGRLQGPFGGPPCHDASMNAPSWWTEERLTLYPRAVLVALGIAFAFAVVGSTGAAMTGGGTLGGDYAAFHAAARLVADGRVAELYDWDAQAAAQQDLHPGETGVFLAFAYPPFVAAAVAPLAYLPFPLAWAAHTLFMAICLFAAVLLLAPRLVRLAPWTSATLTFGLTFYPMFRSVLGGQNTALTLLLVAAAWRFSSEARPVAAGVAAGLLLYKPQFGIPLLCLLVVRDWRALLGGLASASGLWVAGAAVGGVGWVGWWWGQISRFHGMDQAVNAPNSVGLLGAVEAVLGPGTGLALAIGGCATAIAGAVLVRQWTRRSADVDGLFAGTAVGLVLIPPHSMFYDAGLGVLALWWLVERGRTRAAVWLWAAGLSGALATTLGANPLAIVLLVLWVLTAREASVR